MDDSGRSRLEADEDLAARLHQVRRRERIRGLRKREWVFLSFFLVLSLGAYANFQRVIVQGHSMEPTFRNGQTLLVWKFAPRNKLNPGDVIVFRHGQDELIKRIVFITGPMAAGVFPPPGFPSRIATPNGVVGVPPNDNYSVNFASYFNAVRAGATSTPPPDDTIYVMGDNFRNSNDSRDFGPISPSLILGKVIP